MLNSKTNIAINNSNNVRINKQLVAPASQINSASNGQYCNGNSAGLVANSTKSTPSLASAYFPATNQ